MTSTGACAPAAERPPHRRSAADTALCVFAVCGTDASAAATSPPGSIASAGHARGGPVTLLDIGEGLSAVVQEVPSAEFTQEALSERLADRVELEACARAHHATVAAAAALGPVLPLPLATLFTGPERAVARLAGKLPQLHAALARVEGRSEWAVKVCLRRGAPPREASPQPRADGAAGTGSGRAYLDRVRARERDRLTRHDAAAAAAERVHLAAASPAVGCVRRHPHGPEITGKDRIQLMNAAYLVPHERTDDFLAAVRRVSGEVADADVQVEITGPWVPYSFAEPDGPSGAGGGGTAGPGRT